MLPSWQLARNQLTERRVRSAFLTVTVTLAAALIVAVSCSIASAQQGVSDQIERYLGNTDARIIHSGGGQIDAALLETVRAWPGVRHAVGRLAGSVTVRGPGPDPRTIVADGIGVDLALEPRFRDLPVKDGRFPTAEDEALIDPLAATWLQAATGDTVTIPVREETFRVTGILDRPEIGPPFQRPKLYVSLARLQPVLRDTRELSSISIMLEDETDPDAFCATHRDALAIELVLEPATVARTGFDKRLEASRIGLTIAALLTFICSSFIVVTGLTSGVSERERELGLLRCIGARRRQLFAAQLWVGVFYGAAGTVLGIPLGIALSAVLVRIFPQFMGGGLTIHGQGVLLAAGGALGCGVLGALIPAMLASRVSPMEALTVIARPPRARGVIACGTGAVIALTAQRVLFMGDDPEQRYWSYVFVGLPCLLVGWFLLGVPALSLATRLLGPLLGRLFRLPAGLLVGSLRATPFRHGFTAGALMVGMAILVDVWAAGLSIQRDWIEAIRFADAFAFKLGPGIPPEDQAAIEALPFVDAVTPIIVLPVEVADRQIFGFTGLTPSKVTCVGFDPQRFLTFNALEWIQGEPEEAMLRISDGTGVIVADRFLVAKGMGVGEEIRLKAGRMVQTFEIVGVVSAAGLDIVTQAADIGDAYGEIAISSVFLDYRVVNEVFGHEDPNYLQINLIEAIDDDEAGRQIRQAAPGVLFFSGRAILETILDVYDTTLTVQSTVALGALVLAALSVANVLAASAQGRRYEFGVLRAVGARRGTVTRLVLAEATTLALTGAAVGTLCGFHLAWVDTVFMRELAGLPVRVMVPMGAIGAGWTIQLAVTLGFALPAVLRLLRMAPGTMLAAGRNE